MIAALVEVIYVGIRLVTLYYWGLQGKNLDSSTNFLASVYIHLFSPDLEN